MKTRLSVDLVRETTLIRWLQSRAASQPGRIKLGIGDDAAILSGTANGIVVTADLIAEGTHFRQAECSPQQIGRKAMAVNLSDLAAMAARPMAAFVSLLLPKSSSDDDVIELMQSMSDLAREFDCEIAGGDTNTWDGGLAINVTLLGEVTSRGPLLRSGAKPGDVLLVTGSLGGSLAGHHFDFTPRVQEALALHENYELNAGMDLSDGIGLDLRRLCEASSCGAEIDAAALPSSQAARDLSKSESEVVRRCLGDGEDFELLFSASPTEAERILAAQPLEVPITAIGRCTSRQEDGAANVWLIENDKKIPMPELGFEHGGP